MPTEIRNIPLEEPRVIGDNQHHIIKSLPDSILLRYEHKMPLIADMRMATFNDKTQFTGTIAYYHVDNIFFTTDLNRKGIYNKALLRNELQITEGKFNALIYNDAMPTVETYLRLIALDAPRPDTPKDVTNFITLQDIQHNIQRATSQSEMTVLDIARASGLSRNVVYKIRDSLDTSVSMTTLLKYMDALPASMDDIFFVEHIQRRTIHG